MLKLILPTLESKEQILGYKKEFLSNKDSMDGTAGLQNAETYEEWHLVGMIDIRHRLNDYLL